MVLLRMEFTCALPVTGKAVVSYTAISPLPESAFLPPVRPSLSGRYISAALVLGFLPPDVIRHPAL